MDFEAGLPAPATAETGNQKSKTEFTRIFGTWERLKSKKGQSVQFDQQPRHVSQSDSHHIPPQVTVTEGDVLESLNIYKCFRLPSIAPDVEVKDLPNFDDVTQYEVSEEVQEVLWRKEVSRLVDAVQTDNPLRFQGSSDLSVDSKRSYEILTDLADQVWIAICILSFDSQSLFAEHEKELCFGSVLERSRMTLDLICNKDEQEDGENQDDTMPRAKQADFVNFVNYATAVLARIFCTATEGKSLHPKVLAHLARISTKLKVLSAKPHEFCQISLDNGIPSNHPIPNQYGTRERQGGNGMNDGSAALHEISAVGNSLMHGLRALESRQRETLESKSKKGALRKIYLSQCAKFQFVVLEILGFLVISLRGTNRLSGTPITSYEICAIVYKTGFGQFPTLVFQDRENDFWGTSEASNINCARSAFHLLNQTIRNIQDQTENPSNLRHGHNITVAHDTSLSDSGKTVHSSDGESVGTRIVWRYEADKVNSDSLRTSTRLELSSMSHVINIIVPLMLTSPVAIGYFDKFITLTIFAEFDKEREQHPVKPIHYDRYSAFFCLTTKEYDSAQSHDPRGKAKSLSRALIRQKTLLAGKRTNNPFNPPEDLADDSTGSYSATISNISKQRRHELDDAHRKMKSWVFEEKGVMVQCRLYVYTLILFCVVLVLGGIAFGASVGQRISGVDPFNVTSYCWVLAAFILLVAKSVRVHTWSWNDFLHGRVLCKSVSELSSVTGIEDQLILAKLLQDESVSFLETRGPYNAVFRRNSEDGFSIDRPLSMWTMLLSGLIMIEVEAARGRGVVCLDLRRGTYIKTISRLGQQVNDDIKYIYGQQKVNKEDGQQDDDEENTIKLSNGKTFWMNAIGFYSNRNAKFT